MLRSVPFVLALAGCSDYAFEKDGVTPELHDSAEPAPTPEDTAEPVTRSVQETWAVTGKVDIVVFGDTSSSMADELQTLGDKVEQLVDRLNEVEADWHLIAVTGPDGCAQGGILTPDTTDYRSAFAAGITTPPGQDLVDEWGLYDADQAIQQSVPGGCNEGFLRDDAWLHVITISDEDDNSPGWDSGDPNYWVPYIDDYRAVKADPSTVHFSAVGGPEPEGCDGAEPGRGYWEAAEATEGEFLSICDDWSSRLGVLADRSIVQERFALSESPDEGSVHVFVDGDERVDGWTYDAGTGAIDFDTDLPHAGQQVEVDYTVTTG